MESEPLKGKRKLLDIWQDEKTGEIIELPEMTVRLAYLDSDIMSAIKWLTGLINASQLGKSEKRLIIDWINQAFEDVMSHER